MENNLKTEVERLYKLGFALHWLRPRSKIPVKAGWTKGKRESLASLTQSYKGGYNIGVRLGLASKIGNKFLAVLDVDIKSKSKKDQNDALNSLFTLYPQIKNAPKVLSGRGNGSCHIYVLVNEPTRQNEIKARSEKKVVVEMPSVKPSQYEQHTLTPEQIKLGLRVRPAWEVSLLCEGRQVVLPPSIHPDTGKQYAWEKPLVSNKDFPTIDLEKNQSEIKDTYFLITEFGEVTPTSQNRENRITRIDSIKFEQFTLADLKLNNEQLSAFTDGEGVTDRSAKVFELCLVMGGAGVSEGVILNALTDQAYYLGQTAYDHAKTTDKKRAALWVKKYCLDKAQLTVNESRDVFDTSPLVVKPDLKVKGVVDICNGWEAELHLKKMGKGEPPQIACTYLNLRLILGQNCKQGNFLKRDLFRLRDTYDCATPWGNKKGDERSAGQDDALSVKKWLSDKYGLEPSLNLIDEVLNTVALQNSYHPVKDYLEGLEWDGVPRISSAFKTYLGADMPEPYLSDVSRKFFLACVKRIFEPGAKFDHVVVLEGDQGIGKSSFGNILVSEKWFLDGLPNLHDKDAAIYLQGAWVCELGELAAIYKSANESTKAFITRNVDRIRPPYGQRRMDFKRSTVFLGTTDKYEYLTDIAGNRRFWPVKVSQCNFELLEQDRDQLWAEAMFTHEFFPEPLYLEGETKHQAVAVQHCRRIEDENDAMQFAFHNWIQTQEDKDNLRLSELFENGPFINWNMTRGNAMAAAYILRKAGYQKTHTRTGKIWVLNLI